MRNTVSVGMMAGRAAEQLMCGTISTGAIDDILRATDLAKRMVTEFGMSEKLGSARTPASGCSTLAVPPTKALN